MADPLSITASLVTVIGAIGVIGKGLQKLIALRYAPAIVVALNDEVAGLYCVVRAVDYLTEQHAEIIHTVAAENLHRTLEQSRSTLLELETLVRDKLQVEDKKGKRRLDRSVWLRSATKVQRIKDQIRADRIDLSAALSLLASSAALGLELQLQQLSFTIQTLGDRVLVMGGELSRQGQSPVYHQRDAQEFDAGHSHELQDAESGQSSKDPIESQSATSEQDTVPVTASGQCPPASIGRLSRQYTLVSNHDVEPPEVLRKFRHQSLPVTLTRTTCSLDCSCQCHRENRLKSPDVLKSVIGSIVVGYRATPWSSQPCDKNSCRSREAKITYAFPQWLLRRVISLSMAYSNPQGPDFCLRVMRVRPGDANIFTAVFRGTRNHVERLLGDGDASVLDVDPEHNSALHWAVRRMDLPMIEILINAHSDRFYENTSGSFPYSVAWEKILGESHRYETSDMDLLELLFSDRSKLAFFHFSELHQACLGLSGKALTDVLSFTPNSAIDVVDNTCRTTLSWAAQRGDSIAVGELLKRGADPNRPDSALRTPLHWSIAAETNTCMILLLQNSANINAKDDYGRTTLSSVSSKKDELSFLEPLIRFHADTETEDDEGWKPLHWAAHKDQPGNITLLLNNGAATEVTDRMGRNPLHAAILRNCHRAIEVLLSNGACGAPGRTALGSTTLHIAAEYGDVKTLQMLQFADLSDINIMEENNNGHTAQKIAVGRRDKNEGWAESTYQALDSDPEEWYKAWATFMNSLVAGSKKYDARAQWDLLQNKAPSESDFSDWETIVREDAKMACEDVLESKDASFSLDSITRDSLE